MSSPLTGTDSVKEAPEKASSLVERERDHQGVWRKKLHETLFSDVTDDNATLELKLPQIWAVTENGLNGAPESALRVPICKVLACT